MHKPSKAILSALLFAALQVSAQTTPAANSGESAWKQLNFLFGNWVGTAGEKDTPMGSGQGGFSFEPQLNNQIVVRHNHSEYTTGARHHDLMVIYLDAPNTPPRAIFWDTEGHTVRYNLTFPAANSVVFESEAAQPGPKFRLTYRLDKDVLNGQFEIAPPGSEYKTYLKWTAKKQ